MLVRSSHGSLTTIMDSGQHFVPSRFSVSGHPIFDSPALSNGHESPSRITECQQPSGEGTLRPRKAKPGPPRHVNRGEHSWRVQPVQPMELAPFRSPVPSSLLAEAPERREHLPWSPNLHSAFGVPCPPESYTFHGFPGPGIQSGSFINNVSPAIDLGRGQFNLSTAFRDVMPRPLPGGGGAGITGAPVRLAKPKARKSRQGEFHEAFGVQHMFAMPPPIAEVPQQKGRKGGEKVVKEGKKGKPKSKAGSKGTSGVKGVHFRWRAVEDAHHTRLIDLIKLKPGEEAEFEEELAANAIHDVDRHGDKRLHGDGEGMKKRDIHRLSSLRVSKFANGDSGKPSVARDEDFEDSSGQAVKAISKMRATAIPEERYRKPCAGNPDSEIFEHYYGAKKRILSTLKRAKPLSSMRRPERTKLTTVLSQKRERSEAPSEAPRLYPLAGASPAAEWGRAAFTPPGKQAKSPRTLEESQFPDSDVLGSIPSLGSTPSHPDSEWHFSDAEADENRKKILTQLQKLNDKRARLEAQLTKIQRNTGAPVQVPGPSAFEPTNLSVAQVNAGILRDHADSRSDSDKLALEYPQRAKFMVRDMFARWKVIDKEDRKYKRLQEKQEVEQIRLELEMQEARRQQRKLNFLITQTELYAHFMGKKISGSGDQDNADDSTILRKLDDAQNPGPEAQQLILEPDVTENLVGEKAKEAIRRNVVQAFESNMKRVGVFDSDAGATGCTKATFSASGDKMLSEPKMFEGVLKGYQKKIFKLFISTACGMVLDLLTIYGITFDIKEALKTVPPCWLFQFLAIMKTWCRNCIVPLSPQDLALLIWGISWLASLFSNGINGILADEMGLGKTVQSIAFLAHLAEDVGIWGPFLIVAPASTLHNWQQEFHRFLSKFKAVPYWGTTEERKILRQFWKADKMHTEQATFHVVITSYQLVVQDAPYLKKINWQYMILDEAQAIKSSTSIRWKLLLDFPCRNRLLLTGTPIQNSMAELWALLHFIMPSLFDSHMEFNEWFSRDIENHAENKSQIDEKHLSRLHMILKPFMMRRLKNQKDVEEELSDKIEIMVDCPLTMRQQSLYEALKHKISIDDLLYTSTSTSTAQSETTSTLLNLVMQFRKVCNHPELFERRDVRTPVCLNGLPLHFPKVIYQDLHRERMTQKEHLILRYFLLSSGINIWQSRKVVNGPMQSVLSFCQFYPLHEMEVHKMFLKGHSQYFAIWLDLRRRRMDACLQTFWDLKSKRGKSGSTKNMLLLDACRPLSEEMITWVFRALLVHNRGTHHYSYGLCRVHYSSTSKTPKVTELAPAEVSSIGDESQLGAEEEYRPPKLLRDYPLHLPQFFNCHVPRLTSRPPSLYFHDRAAQSQYLLLTLRNCHTDHREILWYGSANLAEMSRWNRDYLRPVQLGGVLGTQVDGGWSTMETPDKQHLIVDSGKLRVLDDLLHRLKDEGHRVLIYCLMTKMMDILEEFMVFKRYPYIRLDGSSKIADRRDMVNDFQSREDIFVFLLSTRAGGLGINLTAADTVIFYDSDWNPTVDQQAMDRAHRLGQTKQVTVYRLICRNTVEERILQRAQEKSEIQRMVISGGDYRPDTLRPTEVVSLLLDDEEIRQKLLLKEGEARFREDGGRRAAPKRKAPVKNTKAKKTSPRKAIKSEASDSPLAKSIKPVPKSKKKGSLASPVPVPGAPSQSSSSIVNLPSVAMSKTKGTSALSKFKVPKVSVLTTVASSLSSSPLITTDASGGPIDVSPPQLDRSRRSSTTPSTSAIIPGTESSSQEEPTKNKKVKRKAPDMSSPSISTPSTELLSLNRPKKLKKFPGAPKDSTVLSKQLTSADVPIPPLPAPQRKSAALPAIPKRPAKAKKINGQIV